MAEVMVKSRAIFGFVIPSSLKEFGSRINTVRPGDHFMILGSGDVIFPLLMSVSLIPISILSSLIVLLFSLLGLFATHLIFVNQKIRRPMAALPPIAAITILGYFIAKLI
jgi:presenilin-like A22 family membrane protease